MEGAQDLVDCFRFDLDDLRQVILVTSLNMFASL